MPRVVKLKLPSAKLSSAKWLRSPLSLRQRLLGLAFTVFIVAFLTLLFFINDYANTSADSAFDRLLAGSALTISGAIQVEQGNVTLELPIAAIAMLSSNERIFYSVKDANGKLITGYDDLSPELPLMMHTKTQFNNSIYHNDPIRVVSLGHLISNNNQPIWITIRVAETTGARAQLSQEIFERTVWPLTCLMFIGLGLILVGLEHALSPLKRIEEQLRSRTPDQLKPLETNVPKEIKSLVDTLNEFMARLTDSINMLTSLIGDTAHQLRTPLASIRAQAEVALMETDPNKLKQRIIRIEHNATHASQLIHQILMDVTVSHRLERLQPERLLIPLIITEMTQQVNPKWFERLIINFSSESEPFFFVSDRIALREMLGNLVNNALIYSENVAEIDSVETNSVEINNVEINNVEIDISLTADRALFIRVADRGVGIPDAEKIAVFERFKRGSNTEKQSGTTGSGLGLSIVKRVVDSHNGKISLIDRWGGGLIVEVILPELISTDEE